MRIVVRPHMAAKKAEIEGICLDAKSHAKNIRIGT